jgi:hypothetical protein
MGNIINDIVEEVNIKPNKSKLIIKWVVSISISLIGLAFVFGQFKSSFFSRMDKFEESLNKNTVVVETMRTEMNSGFENVNARIDKSYIDGLTTLQDYQEFNKKQLILVLDYGQTNKALLKEMLEINMMEKAKNVENQVMKAKDEPIVLTEKPNLSINVRPVEPKKAKEYISMTIMIELESNDTIFNVSGGTKEFVNKIDKNKYSLGAIVENETNPKTYDFSYRKKQ